MRTWLRELSIELLAIWFAFRDKRVRWYVRLFLLLPIAYVMSPLDVLSDAIPVWGQVDDLVMLKVSYALIKKLLDPVVLDESRERAAAFWNGSRANRALFWLVAVAIWSFALVVLVRYLYRRMIRAH